MTEIQHLQLNLLIQLDKICRQHNLKYYLAYGSCIGAIRHKGFIPWDHDVDVLMPIEDAIKLSDYQYEFGTQFFVSNRHTDPNWGAITLRLVDRNHRCVVKKNDVTTNEDYVCMDIYPFYNCPPNKIGLLFNIFRSHIYKMLVGGIPKNHGFLTTLLSKFILLFYKKKNRERDIQKIEKKLRYNGNSYEIADYFGLDIKLFSAITYKKEWFMEPEELVFEGLNFYGPTNAHEYLTKRYGDYMTPPSSSSIKNELVVELI